jgi:glycosyltransferase involved in cell wall biosynthesis
MKISVVIPNFNDIRIKRSLDSLYAQTYTNFEIIVIDGGSSNSILHEIYKNNKIDQLYIEKDEGIFDALNKGVRKANGDIIYLMGSDDYLSDPFVFEDVIDKFSTKQTLNGVCIGCEFVNSRSKVIRSWKPKKITSSKIKTGIFPPHFSLFLKNDIYKKVGEFQYKDFKNVACDIFWLLDMSILIPDIIIEVIDKHHLFMEYGGSSTGSYKAVINQFKLVHKYARLKSKHLPFWFLLSPIRTFSKITQFKIFS